MESSINTHNPMGIYILRYKNGFVNFVTHVSENWNQLVSELNTWLVFGRSLDTTQPLNLLPDL